MTNRNYTTEADRRTHEICRETCKEFIPFFDPDFRWKPSVEMYKRGDEKFERISSGGEIIIEIEARDAEYQEDETSKHNFRKLMAGAYNTLDIPLRKSPEYNDTDYSDYLAFYIHSPDDDFWYALVKPRDIAIASAKKKRVKGVLEDFKGVPIDRVFFGRVRNAKNEPWIVEYTYGYSGKVIKSLGSYTLG